MKKKLQKIRNSKVFKIVSMVNNILLTFLVISMLSIVLVQRFSNNKFTLAGYSIYTVVTGSMIPEYNIGDMILAKKVDMREINVGDNVVYYGLVGEVSDKIITHKVISKEYRDNDYYFVTKGVNNALADSEITSSQIKGVVLYRFKLLSFCSHVINNSYGFYFIIFVPFVIFVFFEIIGISKDLKEEEGSVVDEEPKPIKKQ